MDIVTTNTGNGTTDAGFAASLGRFLLVSYAAGTRVEGEWNFVDTDEIVPDFTVIVRRIDDPGRVAFSDRECAFESRGVENFKSELYDLLLGEFAGGTDVGGWWRVRFVAPDLPEWTVRIVGAGSSPDFDYLKETN